MCFRKNGFLKLGYRLPFSFNCDYKIASKAIASRLKFVLSDLIDHDQTGFLKGRSIAENICLINNVISCTHLKDIPGLLLFIDFEKAFDTIEWAFVRKALEHFGFGPSLINWINLLRSTKWNASLILLRD